MTEHINPLCNEGLARIRIAVHGFKVSSDMRSAALVGYVDELIDEIDRLRAENEHLRERNDLLEDLVCDWMYSRDVSGCRDCLEPMDGPHAKECRVYKLFGARVGTVEAE
jgi:hypothetical protein